MTKINIQKGEFEIYKNLYKLYDDNPLLNQINSLNNELIKYHNNNRFYEHKKREIINKKNILISYLGFNETFFDITESNIDEKIELIQNKIKKYDIYNMSDLTEITINENIEIIINNAFTTKKIFSSEIKVTVNGTLRLIGGGNLRIKNLHITNGITEIKGANSININDSKINLSLLLIKSIDNVIIQNHSGTINIEYCVFKNEENNLEILDSNLEELNIENNIFEGRVKISSYEGDKSKIGKLRFENNKINDLRIGHSDIKELEINNIKNPSDSEINIGDIQVDKFILSNIRNLGKIRFYNMKCLDEILKELESENDIEKEFNINNSSFGDSEFQNINIKSFKTIRFFDNLFSDLKYTGVKWGFKIESDKREEFSKTDKILQQRDTYRMLKEVAEKNSDNITALQFYAKEMSSYEEYLKSKYSKENNFLKRIQKLHQKNELTDYVIMLFNKYSSNYGLNFLKPIGLILLINLIFIFLILILSSNFHFTSFDSENFTTNLGYILNGLNITNGYQDIFGTIEKNGFIILLLLLKNIFISPLIYQAIISFRKFSRKI